ncbi:MAG: class I SAM-dependent methyltransferase [Methanobrevibacter sp.]|jgi:ubiquinone/menaquinone biosynthesis C-methylase UbiE|nr:class I SAM-dependent methyltransferase [Candidatus Methanoflexus mossambicus]
MSKFKMVPKNGHRIQGFSSESFIDAKNLLESLKLKDEDVFIDLGCGDGHVAIEAVKMLNDDSTVIAIDVYKPSIEDLQNYVNNENISNLIPILADFTDGTDLDSDFADMILLLNVYHHFNGTGKINETIEEIKRILKRGGRVCVMDYKKQKVKHGGPKYEMRISGDEIIERFLSKGFELKCYNDNAGETIPEGKSHYLLIFENK